jgi:hypothetical protein
MMFLVNSLSYYTFKSSIHEINTRKKIQLREAIASIASYQRGVYYASIRTFNALPPSIANQVTNKKCFIKNLKVSLLDKPLYSSEEYFKLYTLNEE